MGVGDQALISQFLRHIEDIVHLDDTEVRVKPLESFEVGKDVRAPADVAFARTPVEDASSRPIHFVILGDVIHAVVRATTELPYIVSNFDGEAIVEVSGHNKNFFPELVPLVNQLFAFIQKAGPCFFFVFSGFKATRATVRNHKGDSGGEEKEISITFLHRFE